MLQGYIFWSLGVSANHTRWFLSNKNMVSRKSLNTWLINSISNLTQNLALQQNICKDMLVTFNVVLILINVMVKFNSAKDLGYTLKKAGRIQGTTLANINIVTLVTCLNACTKNLKCKSVNYSTVKKTCETMTTSALKGEIINADGWQYHGNYLRDGTLVMLRDIFFSSFLLFVFLYIKQTLSGSCYFGSALNIAFFNYYHIFKNVFLMNFILCEVARVFICIVLS